MEIQNTQMLQVSTEMESGININSSTSEKSLIIAKIQAWLISHLAELLEIDSNEVDVRIPFERYGLDSSAAISLISDLGNFLGHDLEPTLPYDYPTIEALSQYLVNVEPDVGITLTSSRLGIKS